jgi:hypothetical protein
MKNDTGPLVLLFHFTQIRNLTCNVTMHIILFLVYRYTGTGPSGLYAPRHMANFISAPGVIDDEEGT